MTPVQTSEAYNTREGAAVLRATFRRGSGLEVVARFACGHQQRCWFPQARKGTSTSKLRQWLFGPNGDELCSNCRRERAS